MQSGVLEFEKDDIKKISSSLIYQMVYQLSMLK